MEIIVTRPYTCLAKKLGTARRELDSRYDFSSIRRVLLIYRVEISFKFGLKSICVKDAPNMPLGRIVSVSDAELRRGRRVLTEQGSSSTSVLATLHLDLWRMLVCVSENLE